MSEDEQMRELWETRKEIETLEREVRCRHARKDRYLDKMQYVQDHINRYFSAEALQSGAIANADLRAWPSQDNLADLCHDLANTEGRLRNARNRLNRF